MVDLTAACGFICAAMIAACLLPLLAIVMMWVSLPKKGYRTGALVLVTMGLLLLVPGVLATGFGVWTYSENRDHTVDETVIVEAGTSWETRHDIPAGNSILIRFNSTTKLKVTVSYVNATSPYESEDITVTVVENASWGDVMFKVEYAKTYTVRFHNLDRDTSARADVHVVFDKSESREESVRVLAGGAVLLVISCALILIPLFTMKDVFRDPGGYGSGYRY